MTELTRLLRDAVGARTIDEVVRDLAVAGYPLGRNTVARFLRGDHGPRPSEKVLVSFAETFAVDVRDLREAAGRPRGELGTYEPPDEASSLTQPQRDAVDQLIKAIVHDDGGDGSDPGQGDAEKSDDDDPPLRAV